MFEDPEDSKDDTAANPDTRLGEKIAELRIHAELCAVFEGIQKFDANLDTSLDGELTRSIQKAILKLTSSKMKDSPVLDPQKDGVYDLAWDLLNKSDELDISTSDYHVYRRPGEVIVLRWLKGDQVEQFYTRLQAHLNVAIEQSREDERQALGWKQDAKTKKYLDLLDEAKVDQADRYLRPLIKSHGICVLSQTTADELNIGYLCDYIMGIPAAKLVGPASAPKDDTDEQELAWFFRLFALRGLVNDVELMLFFTYLQKAQDSFELDQDQDEDLDQDKDVD